MGHWLAPPGSAKTVGHLKRFDARYWTVNFPRPMMASAVTTGPDTLRVGIGAGGRRCRGAGAQAEDRDRV